MYDDAWFKKRAFSSLKRINDEEWDYSDSLLAYIPGTESEYESAQSPNTLYAKLVTIPERSYLKSIAGKVADLLPQEFEYIDLGPGTEHKEQFLFDELKKLNKHFLYRPVDISKVFLKLAAEYATNQGIEAKPIQSAFEDLPNMLEPGSKPRFVSLGLTYTNYLPEDILRLLGSIAGNIGKLFIEVQIRDRVNIDEVMLAYENDLLGMVQPRLKLLGLNADTDIERRYCDDGIRIWCVLKNSNPILEKLGVTIGTKLMTFQSLRSTTGSFEEDIKKVTSKYTILDNGETFVGALLG